MYIDFPTYVLGLIETCRLDKRPGKKSCRVNKIRQGTTYDFFFAPKFSIAMVFENLKSAQSMIRIAYKEKIIPESDLLKEDVIEDWVDRKGSDSEDSALASLSHFAAAILLSVAVMLL